MSKGFSWRFGAPIKGLMPHMGPFLKHRAPLPGMVGLIGLSLVGLWAMVASPAGASGDHGGRGTGLNGYHSEAPVDYAADHIELLDKQDQVLLTGDVDVVQDDLHLRSARGLVSYSHDSGGLKIHRLDASGGVHVTRGEESARGDIGIYDLDQHIITLVGNVALHRGGDVLHGARLVIDLDSGLSRVDGRGAGGPVTASGTGRVSGSFQVPKKKTS